MKTYDFHDYLRLFLSEYLPHRRNFSDQTIRAYKQTFRLIKQYFEEEREISFSDLDFNIVTKESIYEFLLFLKDIKNCSVNTLNLRLSAIKSFFRFCGEEDIEYYSCYLKIKSIHQFRGGKKNSVEYLVPEQIKLILAIPDTRLRLERRNQFLMIFMYETGMRVSEIINFRLSDIIRKEDGITLRIRGKGSKTRYVPLLEDCVRHLNAYISAFHSDSQSDEYLFYTSHNSKKTKMSSGTVDAFLKRYAKIAHEKDESFPLNLHAHMFRHSVAMSMYKNAIPISYIKDFLGHADLSTTSVYSYADNETIRKALESVQDEIPSSLPKNKKWKGKEEDLMKYCCID